MRDYGELLRLTRLNLVFIVGEISSRQCSKRDIECFEYTRLTLSNRASQAAVSIEAEKKNGSWKKQF